MSCNFVRPIAPGGELPSGTAVTFELVDADVFVQNWNILFSLVNGGLTFSDFYRNFSSNRWPEQWFDLEGAGDTNKSIWGQYHDHDGIHSSFLGEAVIDYYSVGQDDNNLGVVDSGVAYRQSIVLSGSSGELVHDQGLETFTEYLAIPWDTDWKNKIYFATGGSFRLIIGLVVPSASSFTNEELFKLSWCYDMAGAGGFVTVNKVLLYSKRSNVRCYANFIAVATGGYHV
jgi:hypothetical protein